MKSFVCLDDNAPTALVKNVDQSGRMEGGGGTTTADTLAPVNLARLCVEAGADATVGDKVEFVTD